MILANPLLIAERTLVGALDGIWVLAEYTYRQCNQTDRAPVAAAVSRYTAE